MSNLDGVEGPRVYAQQVDVALDPRGLERVDRALSILLERQGPRRRIGKAVAQPIRRVGRPLQLLLEHFPHGTGAWRHVQEHQRHALALAVVTAQVHLSEASRVDTPRHFRETNVTDDCAETPRQPLRGHRDVSAETCPGAGAGADRIMSTVFIDNESEAS